VGDTGTDKTTFTTDEAAELARAFAGLAIVGANTELELELEDVSDVVHNLEVIGDALDELDVELEAVKAERALWKVRRQVLRDLVAEVFGVATKGGAPE
jgi:hypothetical protein